MCLKPCQREIWVTRATTLLHKMLQSFYHCCTFLSTIMVLSFEFGWFRNDKNVNYISSDKKLVIKNKWYKSQLYEQWISFNDKIVFNRAFYVFLHSLRFGFSRSNFRFRNSHCTIKHDSVKVITKDWKVSHRNINNMGQYYCYTMEFFVKASRTCYPA